MAAIRNSLLIFAFFCSAAIAETPPVADQKSEANKPISLTSIEPSFELRLPANPTTGYNWYLVRYDHRLVRVIRNHYEPPKSTLLGAGGTSVWTFRAVPEAFKVPYLTEVKLAYMRPFDLQSKEEKTVTILTSSACHHKQCENVVTRMTS